MMQQNMQMHEDGDEIIDEEQPMMNEEENQVEQIVEEDVDNE